AAFLALPPSLWPATPGSAATANETRRIAWAYYVPYAPNSLASLRRHAAQIDVLSAHWYGIDRNGTLCSCREAADKNQAQVIQIARANGVKIVPMVLNFDQGAEFSMVLNDPEMKAKAIGSLLAELDKQGWDGIQIDFEGLEFSDRGAMTAFMAEIAPLVRGRGKIISQALAAKTFDRPAGWAAGFDYAALAPYADYFTIMTYAYGEETPRSTQPFNWVDASISFAASQIPPEKLLMGVGWYGHAWNHTTKAIGSITWAQAQEHRRAGGATPQWDPIQRAWSFSYSLEGSDYTVWFEDRRSQDERLALMGRYGLGGAAFWRLGQEDPESWDSFAGMFSKPGTVQAPPPPYGALWGDHQIIARLPAWGLNPSSVTVTNTSDRTWTATGGIAFKLGYFWQNAAGDARVEGPGMEVLSSLPRDVPPGATVLVPFQIQAPPTPGAYLLRLDMVQDDGAWFSRRAKDTARVMKVAVTVTPAATAAPGQLAPLDSAALERFDTELRWQTPPGATQVQIQVTPADRDGPAINLIRTATDRFVLPRPVLGSGNYTLLPGMTYIWRVRTTGFGGQAEETHPG
ncbi:MAG: glycosyl hydrolase family 18 protein, partial [Chloroflexi bacterium]|nr:glycosyl hydrolase family 18 protein [Chloroflexota bacterium]